MAACWDTVGEVPSLPCPISGHLIWGTLDFGVLQELIHQGRMLCNGACQLYDLSRQVLLAIWIGRAWKKCASSSSGRVVDSGREIWVGKCQIREEIW